MRSTIFKIIAGLIISALMFGSAKAQQPVALEAKSREQTQRLADELLEVTNARVILQNFSQSLFGDQNIDNCGCFTDAATKAKVLKAWKVAVDSEYKPAAIVGALKLAISETMSVIELKPQIAFRRSDVGQKVTKLESVLPPKGSNRHADIARMMRNMNELQKKPDRIRLLEDIVAASGGASHLAKLLRSVGVSTGIGILRAGLPGRPAISEKDMIAQMDAAMNAMIPMLQSLVVAAHAELYKSLSDDELRQYRDVALSPAALKLSKIGQDTITRLLSAQAMNIGARFAKELQAVRA